VLAWDPGPTALGSSHSYPVDIDLPAWSVKRDPELRRWLFDFGGGLRIEAPQALRQEHQQWLKAGLAAYPRRRPLKKAIKPRSDRRGVESATRQGGCLPP
jgi:hypothetical protein